MNNELEIAHLVRKRIPNVVTDQDQMRIALELRQPPGHSPHKAVVDNNTDCTGIPTYSRIPVQRGLYEIVP